MTDDVNSLIWGISKSSGTHLSVVGRASGGEQGAWIVIDIDGNEHVLKVYPDPTAAIQLERAAATTRYLRRHAYLAPRYIATGVVSSAAYALIERIPGVADRPITNPLLEQLIELNQIQHRRAENSDPSWVTRTIDSVMNGCSGYCLIDTLRNHSPDTMHILSQLQGIAAECTELAVPCQDIVHFDFNPANIVSCSDHVTGIIDWDATCTGDAGFDLATLLFYNFENSEVSTTLIDRLVERSGTNALRLYLGHMILRQLDWSIRHHDEATVEHYLSGSRRILNDVTA